MIQKGNFANIGKILATATVLFFGSFILGEGWGELQETPTVLLILFIITVLFVIASWFEIRLGAWLLLMSGLALGIDAFIFAGRNNLVIALILGLPLLISSGLLFLHVYQLKKNSTSS